jgi:hypothetical protein
MSKLLILGSGHSIKQFDDYDYVENGWTIVAINNAWKYTENWNYLIHSTDYKKVPKELKPDQQIVRKYADYLEPYGGHNNVGYSIMLCSSYYCLGMIKPTPYVIGYLGADMNYTPDEGGNTHFYGIGEDIQKRGMSDPDRMVLQHSRGDENFLENLYYRFSDFAKKEQCNVYNFSNDPDTRLPYKQIDVRTLDATLKGDV